MNIADKKESIEKCIAELEKYPHRIGESIYFRVKQNGVYKMMDINSEQLYNYMNFELFMNEGYYLSNNLWKSAISILKGKYGYKDVSALKNRVALVNGKFCFDIGDIDSENSHYVEVSENGWEVKENQLDVFTWNPFQKPQYIPLKGSDNFELIKKYLNVKEEHLLVLIVYIISLFIPDIEYPILNILGESGTGKSTVSEFIKMLCDPSVDKNIEFDKPRDLILALHYNHVTVADNTETNLKFLNSILCRSVTGGQISERKLYSNTERVILDLRSALIINGINSEIGREDLMSRTIFVQTEKIENRVEKNEIINNFNEDIPKILAGVFEILSRAMKIKKSIKLQESFRMMEFASWGYAIAEAMESGLGSKFIEDMKRNEHTQIIENSLNEPLIMLICNYMKVRNGEEVDKLTSSFYDELVRSHDLFPGGSSEYNRQMLPKTTAAFTKKIKALRGIFRKFGIEIEIDRTNDYRNLSRISISMISEKENADIGLLIQDDVVDDIKEKIKKKIKRIPIIGIREPIFLAR